MKVEELKRIPGTDYLKSNQIFGPMYKFAFDNLKLKELLSIQNYWKEEEINKRIKELIEEKIEDVIYKKVYEFLKTIKDPFLSYENEKNEIFKEYEEYHQLVEKISEHFDFHIEQKKKEEVEKILRDNIEELKEKLDNKRKIVLDQIIEENNLNF